MGRSQGSRRWADGKGPRAKQDSKPIASQLAGFEAVVACPQQGQPPPAARRGARAELNGQSTSRGSIASSAARWARSGSSPSRRVWGQARGTCGQDGGHRTQAKWSVAAAAAGRTAAGGSDQPDRRGLAHYADRRRRVRAMLQRPGGGCRGQPAGGGQAPLPSQGQAWCRRPTTSSSWSDDPEVGGAACRAWRA